MVVIDPDNLDRFQVIFGSDAQKVSLHPVSLPVTTLSETGTTTAGTTTFMDTSATFQTDDVSVGDVICAQTSLDSGHYIITTVVSETELEVVTDSDFATFEGEPEIVYEIREPEGGSIEPGVTLQALYSYAKEEWRTDLNNFGGDDLIRHTFPFEAITSEQFEIGGGNAHTDWTLQNDRTRKAIRTGGWADNITDGSTVEEYAGIITLGELDGDTQVYFQQNDVDEAPEDFEFLGPVNEPIKIFETGDDRRGFLKLFARKKARTYAGSEIEDIGVTTIQTIVNRFPLAHTVDAAIEASDGEILGSSPWREQQTLKTNITADLADVDGNTGTITVTGETFLEDGVVAGDAVHVEDGTHEGVYTILSVDTEEEITVNTAEEGPFTAGTATVSVTSTIRHADISNGEALDYTDATISDIDGDTGTLTSTTGGFTASGIAIGDLLIIGEPNHFNKGVYKVLNVVSDTELTINTQDRPFEGSTNIDFRVVLPGMYLEFKEEALTITDTGDLTFSSGSPATIERSLGSWVDDGVTVGTVLEVSGSANNDDEYTVASATATTISLVGTDSLENEGPTAAPTISAFDAFKRDIGGKIFGYRWRLTGNNASAADCYQFVQHQLRQPEDIDYSQDSHRGDVADLLMAFAAPTGTGLDMFIQNVSAADINNMTFQDATGSNRLFPFLAAGELNFNVNLTSDPNAKYWLFFTNDSAGDNVGNNFGSDGAIIVEDADGNPIAGEVDGQGTVSFTYDYDGNTQRGTGSDGTNAPVTLVAIGLNTAQYVVASGTITRSVANVISAVAALERNYSNPS